MSNHTSCGRLFSKSKVKALVDQKKAVHCPTEEESIEFFIFLSSLSFTWNGYWDVVTPELTYWPIYKEETCYNFGRDGIIYGPKEWYVKHGCEIVSLDDLIMKIQCENCHGEGVVDFNYTASCGDCCDMTVAGQKDCDECEGSGFLE